MSLAKKGRKQSKEIINKRSLAMAGKKFTEERKRKISLAFNSLSEEKKKEVGR